MRLNSFTSTLAAVSISAAALVFILPGPARAASSVIGPGPARVCFEAANAGRADLSALLDCDAAISSQELNARDRAATVVNRGVIHLLRRNAAKALEDFDRAIDWQPDLGEAYVNRGAALILSGDFQGAIASINRGLELGAEDPHEAYFNRAIAYEKLDDLPAAYADYRRAVELKPDWALPQQELARFTVTSAQ
ncbi:MAG: tetratricopeptide repeat protein [Hyphomonadaceae bacterium]|nr:MAG: TPR domain-containing protein [Caulobacteraceae bacterium]MBT9447762.1 tetratricopeptide repeat protein [Hyphomonadaceae bacterium]TPW05134.1 MAG: TPR domain-containing protein [Alphaproteobacteria bacterium]